MNSNLYEKNNYFVILYSHVFYYYPILRECLSKLYFLVQFLSICYRIHRSSYLKYGGPDPAGPRAPKVGGSADPADPVVPTPTAPLNMPLVIYRLLKLFYVAPLLVSKCLTGHSTVKLLLCQMLLQKFPLSLASFTITFIKFCSTVAVYY